MNKITLIRILFVLLFFNFGNAQQIAVNEVMSSNSSTIADEDGDYEDWVEIYNYGNVAVNLDGYGLSDDPNTPFKWIFPAVTIAPSQYMVIWASDKNRTVVGAPLHTNFKISSSGENIVLTHPDGTLVDQAPSQELEDNVSIGRQPDGTGPWLFFYTATPNQPNTGTGLTSLLTPPVFSHNSGYYSNSFTLNISHPNPSAVIIYTVDGSEPNINNLGGTTFQYKNQYPYEVGSSPGPFLTETYISNTYTTPLTIVDRSNEPDRLATKNTRQHPIYVPPVSVRKGTVVKARAYIEGIASPIVSKSYFVWPSNPYQIPVISLQIQENYLFDYNDGIYTAGVDFDTWRANNPTNNQAYRPDWCNYWRSGSTWEYPLNVEFFDGANLSSVMNSDGGFRIHGNNSRANAIKSLRLYARGDYSPSGIFEHNLMNEIIPGSPFPNNQNFKRIMLRGDGTGGPVAYDVVFNRLMQPVYEGMTRIRPAVHFINGEYWGITAIRDRFDNHHYAINYGLDSDNIAQIDCKGYNCELDEGEDSDFDEFIQMRNFINQNDMSNQALYEQAASMLDMKSFVDHMVIEIFSANDSYERKFWKAKVPENDTYGDGKWRINVQDFEASLKSGNWVQYWSSLSSSPNEQIFASLLANTQFRNQFINRYADLMNTAFVTSRFNTVINQTFDEVQPYLAEDQNRFYKDDFYTNSEKTNLLNWAQTRVNGQRNDIKNHFNLPALSNFTLNVSEQEAGIIKINTVTIEPSTPGVSQNPYPWNGVYFESVPVTLTAIANPGYVFSHWSGDVNGTDATLTFTPAGTMQIQANFNWVGNPAEVIHFWLMDSNIANDTPLLNLEATYSKNGLSAQIDYTSCLEGYPFTESHPNWRKGSMERRNAPTPLNYRPEANNDIPYSSSIMRGIQIKQPFKTATLENTLEFNVTTTGFEEIKFSFATESDGAAQTVLIDYWNDTAWSTEGLANASQSIATSYEVKEFDFTSVPEANNNSNFKIRVRFDGNDMFVDDGNRVHFNNIAVEGKATLSIKNPDADRVMLKVYPNPTMENLYVDASHRMDKLILYNSFGQIVFKNLDVKSDYQKLDIQHLPTGIYILKATFGDKEQAMKIVKK